ncbi:MAG: type II toxin-antitoxin system MqsR family toxin [Magnetococcales bacterium]|nr:type II toxin-antitoxin system MqsR family toxin [Magnetococcales bacterium]
MDKRTPTYDLDAFKRAFGTVTRLNVTGTALRTAAAMGCGRAEIVATIQAMERTHFVKSMTSHADHRTWQDVYHVPRGGGVVYLKFTADVLLSFKELDE